MIRLYIVFNVWKKPETYTKFLYSMQIIIEGLIVRPGKALLSEKLNIGVKSLA